MNDLSMRIGTKMTSRKSRAKSTAHVRIRDPRKGVEEHAAHRPAAGGETNTRLQDRLLQGDRCLEAYTITGQRSQETHARVIADPEYFSMSPIDYARAARARASTLNKNQLKKHWRDTNNRVAHRYGHTEAYDAWNKAGSELRSAVSLISNTRVRTAFDVLTKAQFYARLAAPCRLDWTAEDYERTVLPSLIADLKRVA